MPKLLFYTFLGLILMLTACSNEQKESPSTRSASQSAFPVRGLIIDAQPVTKHYVSTGTCNANESVVLKAERAGRIEKIHFTEGASVAKGGLLMTIDASELEARKKVLRTQYQLSEKKLERAKELAKIEAISEEELEELEYGLEQLEAEISEINASLAKAVIRAPFSGQLGFRQKSPGAFVNVGEEIVELVSTTPLKITFPVPEKYMGIIQRGDTVDIKIRNQAPVRLPVSDISPTIDPSNRSFTARVLMDNPDGAVLPGTFAEVNLEVYNSQSALLVPTDAIIQKLGGEEIFVVQNQKAVTQKVTTGIRNENFIEIKEGLSLGDTAIISGILSLRENTPVKASIATYESLGQ